MRKLPGQSFPLSLKANLFVIFPLVWAMIIALSMTSVSYAQAQSKIPVKSVEPFFQQVDAPGPAVYLPKVTYLSPEKTAPIIFSSVGATWYQHLPPGTSLQLEIRLKRQGKYSDWYLLEPSVDEKGDTDRVNVSAFLTTNLADGYQYRISLNSQVATVTPVLDHLKLTFINGGSPAQKTDLLVASRQTPAGPALAVDEEVMPEDFDAADYQTDLLASNGAVTAHNPVVSTGLLGQAESITVFPASVKSTIKAPVRTTKAPTVKPATLVSGKIQPGTPVTDSPLKVISRTDWGADESLRLYVPTDQEPQLISLPDDYYTKYKAELKESLHIDTDANGNQLTWPLSYPESIRKIVIHHTATTKNLEDPKKAIRDIYVWHTLSKGWGDIGYNYIIDQQGNIYEGRAGGEMVVGAHAGQGNFGSIGIAVLGNYQESDPPEAVITALTSLIKEKAQQYNIDTEGASLFRGEKFPNIMGHRDIMSTSCPGERLYDLLPIIRKLAKVQTTTVVAGQATGSDFGWATNAAPAVTINPKSKKMVTFKIKNTSKVMLSKDTHFQVRPNQTAQTFLRNSELILTSKIGKDLQPGATADIQVLLNTTATSGSTLIDLQPVIGGKAIAKYLSFGLHVNTPPPKLKFDYQLLSVIYDKTTFNKGDLVTATVRVRNTGVSPWTNTGGNRITLGADKPRDHQNSLLVKPSNRYAEMNEKLVQSNGIASFTFQIKVPGQDGIYKEYFTPVVEGIQWMNNHDSYLQVKVGNSNQLITTTPEEDNDGAGAETISTVAAPTSSAVNIAPAKMNTTVPPRAIRIDLAYRGTPAVISADGAFSLYQGATKLASLSANQKASVSFQNNNFQVIIDDHQTYTISAKPRFVPAAGTIMRIDNWNHQSGSNINYNQYRGVLEAIIYDGELHLVNELSMEDYLRGLAEENDREPLEKIKAMMIIARTYGRFYMDVAKKFPGAPFDLNDDPQYSQKYLGYAYEKRMPLTTAQVAATAGQYVTYQGKLIKTPYFSRSDGRATISAKTKWGWTDAPFLTSVSDTLCQSTAFAGHGVGLSGCGATAMAKSGKTYDQIIKHYYQGTELTQAAH